LISSTSSEERKTIHKVLAGALLATVVVLALQYSYQINPSYPPILYDELIILIMGLLVWYVLSSARIIKNIRQTRPTHSVPPPNETAFDRVLISAGILEPRRFLRAIRLMFIVISVGSGLLFVVFGLTQLAEYGLGEQSWAYPMLETGLPFLALGFVLISLHRRGPVKC